MPSIHSAVLVSRYIAVRDTPQETHIPVAAMVGGLIGGILLAILALICYMWWAKVARRAKQKREMEADAQRRTRRNTDYNASATLTKPWPAASFRQKLHRPVDSAKVKFTEKADGLLKPSPPKPLRSTKTKAPMGETLSPTSGVPRMPSTVSSVSMYSTASGEERQVRVPTSLILALGSIEAALTRGSWMDRKGPPHRVSQATSGSAYSQDVGVAY
ncbi:hypothetical protein R3P38DRAFT_1073995 [Favolaschia claudopus]|uniref:Uncharacterized protein n=1 Tax=Favolaschia claudopus TaxID=2862362 RepID=A0AAW0BDJ0_9AGAR